MKTEVRQTLLTIVATCAVLTFATACDTGEASAVADADAIAVMPVPVEIAASHRADIYATYSATASITSDKDAPVTARVSGEIVELIAEEGDFVAAGQVLARIDGERLRLEMLSAKANLDRAKREHKRNIDLHERGIVSTAMFEGLKFDLDSLQATYELRRLDYDYANIRATISGVVSSRDVKLGENLSVGQQTFRITETSQLQAHLNIPQAELSKFEVGHSATVSVAAMPAMTFTATIVRISPTIDMKAGTFRATALIPNNTGALAPGMFGQFTIDYEKHADALVIPVIALIEEDQEEFVYVVRNGEVARQKVQTGISSGAYVEVLDGLQDNDQVVVVGQSSLRNGSKVLAGASATDRFTG